jgi:hypothetical protein
MMSPRRIFKNRGAAATLLELSEQRSRRAKKPVGTERVGTLCSLAAQIASRRSLRAVQYLQSTDNLRIAIDGFRGAA